MYKRGKWWWTDFSINGLRFRVPLRTTERREARQAEREAIAKAQAGELSTKRETFAHLAFSEALDRLLDERKPDLARNTINSEKQRAKPLKKFFGTTPLVKIT